MLSEAEISCFRPERDSVIPVKFDPRSFAIERKNNYVVYRSGDSSDTRLQFTCREITIITVCLYFESTGTPSDVRSQTGQVTGLMAVDDTIHAPPVLVFTWGKISYLVVIESIREQYLDIQPDRLPSEANLNITFREYRPED
jgi:hypothetical protein